MVGKFATCTPDASESKKSPIEKEAWLEAAYVCGAAIAHNALDDFAGRKCGG
jgi:hypothetical protein